MSEYYKGKRGKAWNYGGDNWKLSRSKIDLFLECPRCFYLDSKLGIKRVPGFPFSINSAVFVETGIGGVKYFHEPTGALDFEKKRSLGF